MTNVLYENKMVTARKYMASDNDLSLRSPDTWPQWIDYQYIHQRLSLLTEDELYIFVAGEETEIANLVSQYNLEDINWLLNQIFDGPLMDDFFLTWEEEINGV